MRGRRWLEPAITGLGDRLGLSAGQTYTVLSGLVVAVGLLGLGLPPVVGRHVVVPVEQAAATPDADAPTRPDAPVPVVQSPVPSSFGFVTAPSPIDRDTQVPQPNPPVTAVVQLVGVSTRFATVPDPGAPAGIAVGPDGTVYVATGNALAKGGGGPGVVVALNEGGETVRTWSIEGMPAARSIGLTDLAVDADGAVWLLDASTARVLRIAPDGAGAEVVATLPDVPACTFGLRPPPCEPGLSDGAPEPRGLAIRPAGGVFVADRVQATIWSVDEQGQVAKVVEVADRLAGEGPVDVAVLGDGSLVATVSARLGSVPPGLPAVVRFRNTAAGFEAAEVVVDLEIGDAPSALVPTATGRVFVALSGVNEVIDLGLEQRDGVRYGAGLDPDFDVPVGLALRERNLLVTNQGPVNADASRWLVIALGVADRPPPLTTRSTS